MKTRFSTMTMFLKQSFAILLVLSVLCSCKKDSDNTDPGQNVYVKAQIDGQSFSVGGVPGPGSTTGGSAIFSKSENKLFIYGTGTTKLLAITVQDFPKKTGTYALGDADQNSVGHYTDNSNSQNPIPYVTQNGRTGSLVVTGFDGKTITGTFSYTTYSNTQKKEVKVTNGEFKVTYTEI